METIKVKPWSEDQGDHVVINAEDFDEAVHVRVDPEPSAGRRGRRAGAEPSESGE